MVLLRQLFCHSRPHLDTIGHLVNASPYLELTTALVGQFLGGAAAAFFLKKHRDKAWLTVTFGAPMTKLPLAVMLEFVSLPPKARCRRMQRPSTSSCPKLQTSSTM